MTTFLSEVEAETDLTPGRLDISFSISSSQERQWVPVTESVQDFILQV